MFSTKAYAMGQAAAGGEAGPMGMIGSLAPIFLIILVFYFLMIRPQQKQARRRRDMLSAIKKDDAILTSSGMYGRILEVDGDNLLVDLGEFKACMVRSAISTVLPAGQKLPLPMRGKSGKKKEARIVEEDDSDA
ncbi:MAG: preprotein translocase subunit YajC [Deltaproteobacteria bacterium]|jgi:preprotein translocase subunit YajC|nr:preprotein translocase subunit YajC [Deltaproteobacteria bacterium]